jgi:hypothetical protein
MGTEPELTNLWEAIWWGFSFGLLLFVILIVPRSSFLWLRSFFVDAAKVARRRVNDSN